MVPCCFKTPFVAEDEDSIMMCVPAGELQPIKEKMAKQRSRGNNAQVDPNELVQLQARISEQVHKRYGVTEQEATTLSTFC